MDTFTRGRQQWTREPEQLGRIIDNDALRELLKKGLNNQWNITKYESGGKKERNTCRLEASTSKNTRQGHGGEKR